MLRRLVMIAMILCPLMSLSRNTTLDKETAPFDPNPMGTSIKHFFDGWGPTGIFFGGLGLHYVYNYSTVSPTAIYTASKDYITKSPRILLGSLVFLGSCIIYNYYKPRVKRMLK